MKAKATNRATLIVTKVVSNDDNDGNAGKSNGDCNKSGRQATAMRVTAVVRTMVGDDEGDGNGNEGSRQQRG